MDSKDLIFFSSFFDFVFCGVILNAVMGDGVKIQDNIFVCDVIIWEDYIFVCGNLTRFSGYVCGAARKLFLMVIMKSIVCVKKYNKENGKVVNV